MRIQAALLAAVAAVLVAGLTAADAEGPVIHTTLPCYLPNQEVKVSGTGFHPADRYTVTLDHTPLGTGTVRPDGRISGQLPSGAVSARTGRVLHRITVADGALAARVGFHTSAFGASLRPASGDPRTLRVRYTVNAIGLAAPVGSLVWLHYLDPVGRVRRNAGIGRTTGVCGTLHSIRHRLFPLPVSPGVWRLQFDLRPTYSSATRPRAVLNLNVR